MSDLPHLLQGFIAAGTEDDESFNALACQVFASQYERNAPYRRFCDGRGVRPATVQTWRDIPAVPAVAFKRFALTAAPESDCELEAGGRVFHSSGTTVGETSRHFLNAEALHVYCASLCDGYRRFVLPDGAALPILALMSPPVEAPHSSLSFMLGELVADYGGAFYVGDEWQNRFAAQLRSLTEPVVLFGTAFAWVHFFDAVTEAFRLPAGSRVVETGGFKGRSREVSRDELYAQFQERLSVPGSHCVSEYGMSEMASQFYDSTLIDAIHNRVRPVRKLAAPTLRTRIIDPVTGRDSLPGEPGLLTHYDLANLNSVSAIQTEDMGIWADHGDGFLLLGRAPGAILRGCSLAAEEMNAPPVPR